MSAVVRAWAAILTLTAAGFVAGPTGDQRVLLAGVDGAITPVVADYLVEAVADAEEGEFEALVVTLDTPGGLDQSMRDIIQAFLGSRVPVVVFVSPEGARAASAGTFITMAAHVAAMAPATSIGAATPVDLQGAEITDKIINDAASFAVAVAERRGRNAKFAQDAVRTGKSVATSEALEIGVVDFIASDLDELLTVIHGHRLEDLDATLDVNDAIVERKEISGFRSILGRLADPNLAFLFMSIGTLALIYEVANPGLGFAGIAGLILLVLAFFALSVLPVQAAGIALFVLAIALLVAELFVPGVGVFAAGGAIALLLSGLFLFEGPVRVSPPVLWPTVVIIGISSALAGRAVFRARRAPAASGPLTLQGRTVTVIGEGDERVAFLDGTWWQVSDPSQRIEAGARARVVGMEGLRLVIEEVGDDV